MHNFGLLPDEIVVDLKDMKNTKILVVDDKPENLFAVEDLLQELEVEVLTALSGNEALNLMLNHEFALVLLDVQMPAMDGFEVAKLMRDNDLTHEIPIIFVTAYSKDDEHVFKGYDSGAVDYILKPFDPNILRSKVKVFVELYQAKLTNKKMEQEIQKAKSLEAIGILAGGIAHDFNNLLSGIIGNIQLAKMNLTSSDKAYMILDQSTDVCDQASKLARKLITFSKGDFRQPEKIAVESIINRVASSVLGEFEVELEPIMPDDLPLIEVDVSQAEQVFNNLFRNAAEAMSGKGKITVRAEQATDPSVRSVGLRAGDYITVSVEDHGVGIPEANLAKIFDPYFSTKKMGPRKGVGLGLSICYSLVKQHGGDIRVDSDEGEGSVFHLYLPCSQPIHQ